MSGLPQKYLKVVITLIVLITIGHSAYASTSASPADTTASEGAGEAVFYDRELGHCLLCHQVNQLDAASQGTLGPSLSNVGNRLSYAQIRERIANAKAFNPNSIMPAYAGTTGFQQVAREYANKSILTEQQINQVAAFVATFRQKD